MKEKTSRKLSLKKQTISTLNGNEMQKVKGGSIIYASSMCAVTFTRPYVTAGCATDFTRPGTIFHP